MRQVLAVLVVLVVTGCGSSSTPPPSICGNGKVEAGETCDDGNLIGSDGCSARCALEAGWSCPVGPNGTSACVPISGDGVLVGPEVCDDGNVTAGDGCSSQSLVEVGFECHGVPSVCTALAPRSRTPPTLGAPLTGFTVDQWTWIDVPGASCGDGTQAGFAVLPGTSSELLFHLTGGWVCSSATDCADALANGGLRQGSTEFQGFKATLTPYFRDSRNPYPNATVVFVAYCTGDLHAGAKDTTYAFPAGPYTVHHRGHSNLVAFMERVAATWPSPSKLLFTGYSAGGFGATFNYDTARLFWPDSKAYLAVDSGPFLTGSNPVTWWPLAVASWGLQDTVGLDCPTCVDDPSLLQGFLYRWYPNDRKAFVGCTRDPNISVFYGLSPTAYEARLLASTASLDTARWKWLIKACTTHGLAVDDQAQFDFNRADFLDAPNWCSISP
jgi:cysteine-rich repeat protein